jgi:uncharacterized protein (TIGR00156 family)
VRLQGYIVEHIREDYYLFRDATGDIRVEIYSSRMPKTPFTSDTKVSITGEVDLFLLRPEIWVTSISLTDQQDQDTSAAVINATSDSNDYNYDNY